MKIVVTGTGGFIGGHLQTALEREGHYVVPFDRKSGNHVQDFDMDLNVDMVIHLAADADVRRSIEYPDEYWENNVEPTTKPVVSAAVILKLGFPSPLGFSAITAVISVKISFGTGCLINLKPKPLASVSTFSTV